MSRWSPNRGASLMDSCTRVRVCGRRVAGSRTPWSDGPLLERLKLNCGANLSCARGAGHRPRARVRVSSYPQSWWATHALIILMVFMGYGPHQQEVAVIRAQFAPPHLSLVSLAHPSPPRLRYSSAGVSWGGAPWVGGVSVHESVHLLGLASSSPFPAAMSK